MKKLILKSLCVFVLSMMITVPVVLSAGPGEVTGNLTQVAQSTDLIQTSDFYLAVGKIIQIFLGFLGVIMVIVIMYGGFIWMTAGGDSAKVDKAKGLIRNAIIGVLIVLAAYAISAFTIEQVYRSFSTALAPLINWLV